VAAGDYPACRLKRKSCAEVLQDYDARTSEIVESQAANEDNLPDNTSNRELTEIRQARDEEEQACKEFGEL
jgi:hypothetical protein